ncbi:MAG: hypothetical protein K2G41_08245 [Duncaniella sp.]|nr:hypothetical protein [Duncaniella sp.]MDE6090678.1 hypothetical protein [Duncaniella sp.]
MEKTKNKKDEGTSQSPHPINLTFLVDFVLCVALIVAISLLTLAIQNYK